MNKKTLLLTLGSIGKKLTSRLLKVAILIIALGFMMVKAPQYHGDYIRGKVGSQVFMLTNKAGNHGGTGFEVKAASGKVYTVTNSHVCGIAEEEGSNGVIWASSATLRKVPLHVIERSTSTDLCILTAVANSPGLNLASSVRIGEQIGLVGHPQLMPITLSKGELIGYAPIEVMVSDGPCTKDEDMYKTIDTGFFGNVCVEQVNAGLTNVPSLGGNSGSPVVDIYGDVVAVLFAGNQANWGFVISLEDLKTFLGAY